MNVTAYLLIFIFDINIILESTPRTLYISQLGFVCISQFFCVCYVACPTLMCFPYFNTFIDQITCNVNNLIISSLYNLVSYAPGIFKENKMNLASAAAKEYHYSWQCVEYRHT